MLEHDFAVFRLTIRYSAYFYCLTFIGRLPVHLLIIIFLYSDRCGRRRFVSLPSVMISNSYRYLEYIKMHIIIRNCNCRYTINVFKQGNNIIYKNYFINMYVCKLFPIAAQCLLVKFVFCKTRSTIQIRLTFSKC